MYPDVSSLEKEKKFQSVSCEAWIEMIWTLNGISYECHQRHLVFLDCLRYGITYGESFDCALTCNSLPKVIFEK